MFINIYGTKNNDILNGTANNDTLYGGSGNDIINAGNGNDVVSWCCWCHLSFADDDTRDFYEKKKIRIDAIATDTNGNTYTLHTHHHLGFSKCVL